MHSKNRNSQKTNNDLLGLLIAIGFIFLFISLAMYSWFAGHNDILGRAFIVLFIMLIFLTLLVLVIGALNEKLNLDIKWHWVFLSVTPFLIFNFYGALTPVTDADGAGYHLAMPKYYLQKEGFAYHPNVVSNWPMSAEMVYAVMMQLHIPPKLLHFAFGILLALLAYAISKRHFGYDVAAWASVITYTIPMVVLESGIAYVDLFFSFFILLGLYLAHKYAETRSKWDLGMSAIFVGFGASIKWTGPIFVALAFVFLLIHGFRRFDGFKAISKLWWYPLPGIGFCSLWYIKNWVLSGHPFIPFFEGLNWHEANIAAYMKTIQGSSVDIPGFITTLFNLNFNGLNLGELTWIGPIFAAFIPILFFRKNKPRIIKTALWFMGVFYLLWFLTSPQSRLLLPVFVIGAILIAYVIQENKIWKAAATVAIISALPFAVLYHGQAVFVKGNIEDHKIPAYAAYQELNIQKSLGYRPDATVLVYGDIHTYYLDYDYLWARPDMQGLIKDYSNLSKYGITFVVINTGFNEFPDIKTDIYKNNMIKRFEKNGFEVYEICDWESCKYNENNQLPLHDIEQIPCPCAINTTTPCMAYCYKEKT